MEVDEAQIQDVEQQLGVQFPDDYRGFLITEGAAGRLVESVEGYLMLQPLGELVASNAAGEIQTRFPGAVAIGGDGSRELLVYDFRKDPPPLLLLDVTAENWQQGVYQAGSFSELLRLFPERGWDWGPPEDC
ncbi:SMI1/KNR4 family protein [Nonomuraea rubra]|uniref:Knr4/Smi1-like domain-containing protein n=1 Tax=Nonomuraea rubra TaxID=46180 RepID=A0A7X0P591_9ACTN|nr:SMI1/KNR4 family protein [Nonomuraea rubra]MBB6555530.1 hypothetical protein [Nonomuraea rubra]